MHYYSHNVGDYRRDTGHLSLLEHGAYRQLLDSYYLSEKPLALNHADLMRTHCARSADEVQAVENVLRDFFVETADGYIHKRCDIEIEAFHAKSSGCRESAKTRWARVRAEKEASAMRTHSEGNANHKPLTINQELINNIGAPEKPERIKSINAKQLAAMGVDEQHAKDWLAIRKAKRAPLTETALDGVRREAQLAGLTLAQAIKESAERGWQGFKAEWLKGTAAAKPSGVHHGFDKIDYSAGLVLREDGTHGL